MTQFNPFAGAEFVDRFPTTEAQREIWVACQLADEASLAFNEAIELELRGELDRNALVSVVTMLVARHDALRMTFAADGLSAFVEAAPPEVKLEALDLSMAPRLDDALQRVRDRLVTEPFDLVRGPLVRFVLAQCAAHECRLFVCAHHLVCDGWSFGVLVADIAELYSSAVTLVVPQHGHVEKFGDYARLPIDGGHEEAQAYWVAQFTDALPVLELPLDRARAIVRSYRSERQDVSLSRELTRAVTDAGASIGASLFVTLFAMLGVLLRRLCGQDDVVIGVPTAGQLAVGKQTLVGHLVSMLPIRLKMPTTGSVADLVSAARGVVLDAFDHQTMTFGQILRELPIARDAARPPLISVVFNLDRALSEEDMRFGDLRVGFQAVARRYEMFDLFFNAVQRDGGIVIECQYNADVFERSTVARMLDIYSLLLESATTNLHAAADTLPVVRERDFLDASLVTSLPLPEGVALAAHRLIEDQVARTPDSIAVEFGDSRVTYAELDARANRLAHHLRRLGVRRGTFVGLCLERSPDMLVGLLAVLKAGGAYVPLDPGYPAERLAFMARDIDMQVLVTEAVVRSETEFVVPVVVVIDRDADTIAQCSDLPIANDDDSGYGESPAYAIFTSGSTGVPNGVIVPHRSLVNLLLSTQREPGMHAGDVVLAVTTLSFDIAVSEVILPLTVGARIVLTSREAAADGAALRRLVESAQVTFIDATPATYRLLLQAGWQGSRGRALRVICTGEAMPRDLGETLIDCADEVWNGYGPTETTVWSTFWRAQAPIARVLIGKPVTNTRAYVLDANLQPVPIGVRGELFIGGAGVSSGYHNRLELTQQRFLDDPFVAHLGAKMYRTGDVVRRLPDGNLDYLGRNDNQVKLRGYRIELGEIDDALGHIGGVAQAATAAIDDASGNRRLVAFLVYEPGVELSDAALRSALKSHLPDYMVPSQFVRLSVLPLTPSGKIDRKGLPLIERDLAVVDRSTEPDFVEPRTASERLLAELWCEALGVGRVSIRDDFFLLGGHSLLAAQILARLRRDHGIVLAFRKFFEAPTIESFAALLTLDRAEEGAEGTVRGSAEIRRRADHENAPFSILQDRLWLLEELDARYRAVHNVHGTWRLIGALDKHAFAAAINDIARRHDAFRTSFATVNGARVQRVADRVDVPMRHVDLSALADADQRAAMVDEITTQLERPFDLSVAPLCTMTLFELATDEFEFLSVRHAMIWDGWSFDIFIAELAECYAARVRGVEPSLPDLPVRYADFAAWQHQWLTTPEALEKVQWWRAHLGADCPVLALSTDRPRPLQSNFAGDSVSAELAVEETHELRAFARANEASLFAVLFSAYAVLLWRYSGQSEFMIGTPAHARSWVEIERVIGPFINTLALRARLDASMTFAELVRRTHDLLLGAISHSEIPFEAISDRPPVLRALISMQDVRARPLDAGGISIAQTLPPQIHATNDLMLWTMETKGGLRAVLNFSVELFDRATAQRLISEFLAILRGVLSDSARGNERAIGKIRSEGSDDASAVLAPARGSDKQRNGDWLGLDTRDGDGWAIGGGTLRLTWPQLSQRAGQVSRALDEVGTQAGDRIAILTAAPALRAAALVGVLASERVAILIDPRDPAPYVHAVLVDGNVGGVIVGPSEAEAVCTYPDHIHVIALADDGRVAAASSRKAIATAPNGPRTDALLRHAPGASGRPIFSGVTRRELEVSLGPMIDSLALSEADVFVATSPVGAELVYAEWLLCIYAGASLELAPNDTANDPEEFARVLAQAKASVAVATGDAWRDLVASGWRAPNGFRAIVSDGPAEAAVLTGLLAANASVRVLVADAMSGMWLSLQVVSHEREAHLVSPWLGSGRAAVLDSLNSPAPVGVWGVLHREAVDAADFGASALNVEIAGESLRLLPTSVESRRRPDGGFEVRSASSGARFIDGGRVNPATVASIIRSCPRVSDAAIRAMRDSTEHLRLVAYIVPKPGEDFTDSEIRAFARDRLPERMVPSLIVRVPVLEWDSRGVLRAELLTSPFESAVVTHVEPSTEPEHRLASLWCEMLGVSRVSSTDNFFALGGYSLLCFRFIDRVQMETGVRLNARGVLLGTLEQLAAELERAPVTARESAGDARNVGGQRFEKLKALLRFRK